MFHITQISAGASPTELPLYRCCSIRLQNQHKSLVPPHCVFLLSEELQFTPIHVVPSCSTRLHRYGSGCPDAGRDKNARWQFWFCTIPKHCFLLCNLSPSAEMAITAATARVKFSTESLIRMTGYSGI